MYNDERAGVGTHSGTLACPKSVPTPARGNQKMVYPFLYPILVVMVKNTL